MKSGSYSRPLVIWLFTGCILVFAMVVIGGITRLTGSGLSITEWNLLMGAVPPMNEAAWHVVFQKYQASPQFQKQNFNFSLDDFKSIFWWEYIHRLTGRVIGIVFMVPFLYFLFKGHLTRKLTQRLLLIFLLGGFQGFIGWYMVKSGLVDNPRVSHYRLAIHLLTAFLTFGFIFWTALDILSPHAEGKPEYRRKLFGFTLLIFIVLVVQIMFGAFVAGLKGGLLFNTFPKMGDEWIAGSVGFSLEKDGMKSFVENPASIQFIHRSIAWILVIIYIMLCFLFFKSREKGNRTVNQKSAVLLTGFMMLCQFLLGVFTLINMVPVSLGVLHQAGAFFLFASLLWQLHLFRADPYSPSD